MVLRIIVLLCSFIPVSLNAQGVEKTTYPLLIEFYSTGTGVPDSKPFFEFVKRFKKIHHLKSISVDRIGPLGREGEYDLGFGLLEMSERQQRFFIPEAAKVVSQMNDRGGARCREQYNFEKKIPASLVHKEPL